MADDAAMAASEFWSLFHLLAGTHTFDAKEESGEGGQKERISIQYVHTVRSSTSTYATVHPATVIMCMHVKLYYCRQSVQCACISERSVIVEGSV